MTRRRRIAVVGLRAGFLVAVIGAWVVATTIGGVSSFVLPPLPEVVVAFATNLGQPAIWQATGITLLEMVVAFALAVVAGLAVGFVLSRTRMVAAVSGRLLAWGYIFPISLLYPLFLIWVGVGVPSKILFAAASAFFPIAYNTMRGLSAVEPKYLTVGRAFGASGWQVDWHIKWGAARPMILSGLRLGVSMTTVSVILAEMLGANGGLGFMAQQATSQFQITQTYAVILMLIIVTGILIAVMERLLRTRR